MAPGRSLRETISSGAFSRRNVEHGLDRATVAAGADERAVGALAQHKVQRADEDGLAGAGFAGDDVAAGLQFQREVGHQGEVFDAQRGQHRLRVFRLI